MGITSLRERCEHAHRSFFAADDLETEVGMCLPASLALQARLRAAGLDASLARGTFAIDFPDPEAYASDSDEPPAWAYTPVHYWVMVDDVICDITGGQFADECDEEISAVTVTAADRFAAGRYTLHELDPDVDPPDEHRAWVQARS